MNPQEFFPGMSPKDQSDGTGTNVPIHEMAKQVKKRDLDVLEYIRDEGPVLWGDVSIVFDMTKTEAKASLHKLWLAGFVKRMSTERAGADYEYELREEEGGRT